MFSRQEASRIRQEFWTVFGQYMKPVLAAEGSKVNWINYHTRLKDVYFRMDADSKSASIAISIEQNDEGIRQLYFEQFAELRMMLEMHLEEQWEWQPKALSSDGRDVARIVRFLPDVSIMNREDWPALISFFKPRIIALDGFWADAKYSFESLK